MVICELHGLRMHNDFKQEQISSLLISLHEALTWHSAKMLALLLLNAFSNMLNWQTTKQTIYALLIKAPYSTSRSSWNTASESPAKAITEVDALRQLSSHHTQHQPSIAYTNTAIVMFGTMAWSKSACSGISCGPLLSWCLSNALGIPLQHAVHFIGSSRLSEDCFLGWQLGEQAGLLPARVQLLTVGKWWEEGNHSLQYMAHLFKCSIPTIMKQSILIQTLVRVWQLL